MFYIPEIGSKSHLISPDIKKALDSKELIFFFATGRSGTNLFEKIFATLPDTLSVHEPQPLFTNCFKAARTNNEVALKFLVEKKLPFIASIEESRYVETSHIFCKAFLSPLLQLGIIPKLVIVNRDPVNTAFSFYQIDSAPFFTKKGNDFLLSPYEPNLISLHNPKHYSEFQLCYWYVKEIAYRASIFKKFYQVNSFPFITIDFDKDIVPEILIGKLNDITNGFELSKLQEVLSEKVNSKSHIKKKVNKAEISSNDMLLSVEVLRNEILEYAGLDVYKV